MVSIIKSTDTLVGAGDDVHEPRFAGVDVGARKKGFDLAIVDARQHLLHLARYQSRIDVERVLDAWGVRCVGVDSPKSAAPGTQAHRNCELRFARAVCGIRWTPNRGAIAADPFFYGWVINGFRLWRLLKQRGYNVIEVFPTGSWTMWGQAKRGKRARATWSRSVLNNLHVVGVPIRTNQDERDAIAAALTALRFSGNQALSKGSRQRHLYWPIVVL